MNRALARRPAAVVNGPGLVWLVSKGDAQVAFR
jgi:hypothetical protein